MIDNFNSNPDDKLEDALALLAAGIPLVEVLAEAGDDAEWLSPLLEVADQVGDLQATIPIPPPEASLRRMLDYGKELATTSSPTTVSSSSWQQVFAWLGGGWLPRLATGLVTALLVIAFLGGTVIVLAQRSLPGQPLYGLKRAGEALRLDLTQDPAERERLHETYNQLRRQEATMLLQQGQMVQVAFEGRIAALSDATVNLDGLVVQVTPQTEIKGQLAIGARVQMEGLTQPPDKIVALTLTVIETPPPLPPAPAPTSTPTPTPGQSQATDILKLPTATATYTPGLSKATDTLRLPTTTPTHTPTPLPPPPTATPTVGVLEPPPLAPPPAGGDSSNTNDSGNENRGDGNDNSQDNGDDGNANDNEDSGGDDHSGPGDGSDDPSDSGSDDNSGSSDNSGSGGGGDSGSSDNSGSGGSDDHSGGGNDNDGS